MTYLEDQTKIELNKLYEFQKVSEFRNSENTLFINTGTVDVYSSESSTEPLTLANMVLTNQNVGAGYRTIKPIPRYVAFVQNTDTTTEIVLEGLKATEIKSIS